MGKYVERTSNGRMGATFTQKVFALVADGAQVMKHEPEEWTTNLVCLVDNGAWAACGYAFDEIEMNRFLNSFKNGDTRRHKWLIYPNVEEML